MSVPADVSSSKEPREKQSEEVTDQWVVLNGRVTESSQQIGMLRKTIQELIRSMDAERTLNAAVQQSVRELDGKLSLETKTRSEDVRGLRDALRAETAARLELTAIEEGFWSAAQERSTRLEDRAAKMEDLLRDSLERCSMELGREKEAREQLATELHESLARTLALSGQVYDLRAAHEGRLDQKSETHDALQERLLALEKNHKQDMASLKADLELRKAKWAEEIEELRMKFSVDHPADERTEKTERTETTHRHTGEAATSPPTTRETVGFHPADFKASVHFERTEKTERTETTHWHTGEAATSPPTTRETVFIAPPTLMSSNPHRGSSSRATSAETLPREVHSFKQEPRVTSRLSSSALSPPAPGPVSVSPSPAWFIKPCSWSRATSPSPMVATVPRPLRSRRFTCAASPQQRNSGSPTSTIRAELSRNPSRGTLEPQNLQQHFQQRQTQQQQQSSMLHHHSQPQLPANWALETTDGEKVHDGQSAGSSLEFVQATQVMTAGMVPSHASAPWHGARRRSVGCCGSPTAVVSGG